ncbi:MAG TPA: hypothetical protein VMT38_11135 [Terracidiphilus sp.]|nr:hypothetical protein [Terracidiphilus sp.]
MTVAVNNLRKPLQKGNLGLPADLDRRRNLLWIGLFVLLASSLLIPFLVVNEPPLLDYPNHLARTFILAHLNDPTYHFSQYYSADWKPYPYILWDILMVALQRIIPVESAGKFLEMVATILVPAAVAWFLWQANRSEIKLALLACALSYYLPFLWGFTAFHLGMGLCFLMIGTWLWYRRQPSLVRAITFFLICSATYLAHLLCFASAALILLLFELTYIKVRELGLLACYLAPLSALALWARPGLRVQGTVRWHTVGEKLLWLRRVATQGYNKHLDIAFVGGLLLCLLFAVIGNRELRVNWRWLLVLLGLLGVYILLPSSWGTNWGIDMRAVPLLCLLMVSVLRVGRRANWLAALAVVLTALRVVNITSGFQKEELKVAAMDRGIEQLPRDIRVFPLVEWRKDPMPVDHYYEHFWAYAVTRRGATSGSLFDIPGQTPMRSIYKPYGHILEDDKIDWSFVSKYYDYVWSYGDEKAQGKIEEIADKVFEDGPVVLYRIRRQASRTD